MKHVPTLLIVEDNFLIAQDIGDILKEEGYKVINFISSYKEAIQIIEEQTVDLVLTDINLKCDKDGVDLGAYLYQKDNIPFIYISSHTDKLMMNRVNETRPYGFIVKPFKPQDVKTTVSLVLNNYAHRHIDIVRQTAVIEDEVPFVCKQVIGFINEHLDQEISISELAQLTPWQPQHFQRMFTKYVGLPPNQYIIQRRIEKSKCLLIETEWTIEEVYTEVGFKSQSHFFTFFKKHTGKTPDNFRKGHRIQTKYLK